LPAQSARDSRELPLRFLGPKAMRTPNQAEPIALKLAKEHQAKSHSRCPGAGRNLAGVSHPRGAPWHHLSPHALTPIAHLQWQLPNGQRLRPAWFEVGKPTGSFLANNPPQPSGGAADAPGNSSRSPGWFPVLSYHFRLQRNNAWQVFGEGPFIYEPAATVTNLAEAVPGTCASW